MATITPTQVRPKTRNKSLDGLRGAAVLLVVGHHVSGSLVPFGGTVGVTLFFVLSGYLITRLLLKEQESNGRIDVKAFYIRRLLRLYPALLIFLLALPVILFLVQDPKLNGYWWKAFTSGVYVSNLFLADGQKLGILTHTWTLAVEEQFYLVWPAALIVVVGVAKQSRQNVTKILFCLCVLLFMWRLTAMGTMSAERVYFGPDTNAFALVAGAALGSVRKLPKLPRWCGFTAVACLAGLSVFPLADYSHATANAAMIVATFLALIAVWNAVGGLMLLQWAPLVWFGVISYGLYLWHSAFLVVEPFGIMATGGLRLGIAVVAVGVAWMSYEWVELPAMKYKSRFERSRL